jgi:hypothetical protein
LPAEGGLLTTSGEITGGTGACEAAYKLKAPAWL